jgi:hypothetical protein
MNHAVAAGGNHLESDPAPVLEVVGKEDHDHPPLPGHRSRRLRPTSAAFECARSIGGSADGKRAARGWSGLWQHGIPRL